LSSAPRGQREPTGGVGANQIFLLGCTERVRKQIDGLSRILKGDCGFTNGQSIVCQRGQNDVATDFLQRVTQNNTTSLPNNTPKQCGFMVAGRHEKRPLSDISVTFLFVWNFICLIVIFLFH
jgi:hypothetical protein